MANISQNPVLLQKIGNFLVKATMKRANKRVKFAAHQDRKKTWKTCLRSSKLVRERL